MALSVLRVCRVSVDEIRRESREEIEVIRVHLLIRSFLGLLEGAWSAGTNHGGRRVLSAPGGREPTG